MKTAPLNKKQRMLMHCAPFNEQRINDRAMRTAVHKARKSEEWEHQVAFDRAIAELIQSTPIPLEVEEWFSKETTVARPRKTWKNLVFNPVVLAISISLLVIAAIFGLKVVERMNDFPGADAARKMLNVASTTRSVMLDPVKTDAGSLGDLFFMKHRLAHYDIPEEFAGFKTIGVRVFDDEDARRVAQVWLVEKRMQFFLFPADRDPKTGVVNTFQGWRYVELEGWNGAVQEHNGVIFLAAIRGPQKELAQYINKKE